MEPDSDWSRLLTEGHSEEAMAKQVALLLIHGRQIRDSIEQLRLVVNALPSRIEQAVEIGIKNAANDEETSKRFWERGFDHLSMHAAAGINQWVGRRVVMILLAAVLSASIGWAVFTGRFK